MVGGVVANAGFVFGLTLLGLGLATQATPQGMPGRLEKIPYSQTLRPTSGGTTLYFALPFQGLKEAVPALKGLNFDESQERLPSLLASVAHRIAEVLPRLPNLLSREDVYGFQSPRGTHEPGGAMNAEPWNREFRYLILSHHNADGSTSLEELRTDSKGHAAEGSNQYAAPRGFGFAYLWLFFSAANQPEFRFRYLGQQEKDGRKTFVVAFAQEPGKVADPAYFQSAGKVAPFYYQGVLWVDQGTFDIVMLRTDLLNTLPDLHLTMLKTELKFRPVPIHGADAAFWLPSDLDIASDQGMGVAEEVHHYSDYHLYKATSRVLPEP